MKKLYSALMTAFNEDGSVNLDGVREMVRYNIDVNHIDGLYVGGSTGETFMLSTEEKKSIFKVAYEEAAGKTHLIAQVGSLNLNEAKEALESKQRTVLVATADLKSGEEVTMDSFKTEVVQTTMDTTQIIEEDDFKFKDDKTGDTIEKYSEDGTQLQKKLVMKVGVPANSIVTKDMVAEVDGQATDDQRIQEYNMIILPSELRNGDYVDIRVRFPKGQDYIVVSKKQVEIPQINGVDSEDTIWLKLTENEIITMNSAIVDTFRTIGATLRVVTYTEAGIQDAATPTYVPTGEVMQLINSNPNIVQQAKQELVQRYMTDQERVRGNINSNISSSGEDGKENLKTKIEESVTNSKENRKKYLESLGGN